MRNFLVIVVGVVILNGALLYTGAFDYIEEKFRPAEPDPGLQPEVVDIFRETLEQEVRAKIGTPIEGYEPAMYLNVFPGLAASDFDGVQASIGQYVLVNGQLEHQLSNAQLIHSAAGAITRSGYETLYKNVAARTGINVHNGATITDLMKVLTEAK